MDELIEENMGLVVSIVNSFNPKNATEREDLIDAGRIGLWKALQKYENGHKISTFAWRPIRWFIIKEIRSKSTNKNICLDKISDPWVEPTENLNHYLPNDLETIDRKIIELRRQGYKFQEIADELNEKIHIVKNKFYKTIKNLREMHE